MEAKATLVEGMQFVSESDSGHALVVDSVPAVGGRDTGSRPVELVLMGLVSCMAMDVVSILRKRKKEPRRFEVRARAERANEHPKVFTTIAVEFMLVGEFTPAEVERAIELSYDRYCPIAAMLKPGVPITTSYHIESE
ncbi:MAG: OsmC family protein [Chloroflexi bacterium]|nr:OsmC family protein [Chloroflexota bacterium]MBU1747191.1 OsmC family protein [Chloroflexota bacterium]